MKTPDDLFRESIDQYRSLVLDASRLSKSIEDLSPNEILRQCGSLRKKQEKQAKIDKFIVEIMLDCGPNILNSPLIQEYQSMLDIAMQMCNEVALKANARRIVLKNEIQRLHCTDDTIIVNS